MKSASARPCPSVGADLRAVEDRLDKIEDQIHALWSVVAALQNHSAEQSAEDCAPRPAGDWRTIKDVAHAVGLSPRQLLTLRGKGLIRVHREGGHVLLDLPSAKRAALGARVKLPDRATSRAKNRRLKSRGRDKE